MKFLVTGGFGFIGSHLVERLLWQGHSVHVVDNLSSNGVQPGMLLDEWGHPERLTFDCKDFITWRENEAYNHRGFDGIYHLASPVGPAGVLQYAGDMVHEITEATYAAMALAKLWGAKLVDVSTSEVYGGGQQGYCSEEMPRIIQAETTVRLEYAVAKMAAETALINRCKVSSLEAVIIRPFNVAGPRQSGKGGFVLPRFIEQARNNQPLTVFGDGTQIRAFTHVADIVNGLILAFQNGRSGEVYNLGNPSNKTTILELAQQVIAIVGQGTIQFIDPQTLYGSLYAEAADKYPNADKAQRELHWQPTRDIQTTIRDGFLYSLGASIALTEHLC